MPRRSQWDGAKFKISKQGTWSDHFFGLGDKPGPLDRKSETFTMWNTDAFGWQESTDPIYKSIPFFINMNHGTCPGCVSGQYLENGISILAMPTEPVQFRRA